MFTRGCFLFCRCIAIFGFLLGSLVAAFAADPILKDPTLQTPGSGVKKVIFLYQENILSKSNDIRDNDRVRVGSGYLSDVRFPEFGDLLVANGKKHFDALKVETAHIGFVPEGKLFQYTQQLTDMLGIDQIRECIYLIVSPINGGLSRSVGVTTASISFSVRVTEASTSRDIWVSSFVTQTQSRGLFFTPVDIFDDAYAEKILRMLVTRLKRDQVL